MNQRTITQADFNRAYAEYGDVLLNYIRQFMDDELQARKILEEVLWEVPIILNKPQDKLLSYFTMILQFTRKFTLDRLTDDPLFDPWAMWTKEPDFYPLKGKSVTQRHKEIFWYSYYRGHDKAAIAAWLEMDLKEAEHFLHEAILAIGVELTSSINYSKIIVDKFHEYVLKTVD